MFPIQQLRNYSMICWSPQLPRMAAPCRLVMAVMIMLFIRPMVVSCDMQNLAAFNENVAGGRNSVAANTSNAVEAVCDIIREYYGPLTSKYFLLYHALRQQDTWELGDFVNRVLKCLPMLKVQVENVEHSSMASLLRIHNLLVVDSMEALDLINPAAMTKDYDTTEYFLLFLMKSNYDLLPLKLLKNILQYFWQYYIINISGIECKKPSYKRINAFTAGLWEYPIENIFPLKLLNLQNCSLKVAVWHTPPFLSYFPNKTGFQQIGHFEGEMLVEIAKKLNFSMEFIEPPNDQQRGIRYPNGTVTGAMKLLKERVADMSLGSFRLTHEHAEVMTAARSYYQTWQTYAVLATTEPYSSLEILTCVFDNSTWVCLGVSLFVALLMAKLINRQRPHSALARLLMGVPAPSTPLENIVRVLLGVPPTTTPNTNFARFVVVLWFIYGTVIRVAYQSLLFQLLQTHLYHKLPQSLGELIEMDYMLIMTATTYDTVQSVKRIQNGLIALNVSSNSSELSTYYRLEQMSERRLAGVSSKDFLTYYKWLTGQPGLFYMLPEKVFTLHNTMYFSKHSYLVERFNSVIMNLRGHGLIEHWAMKGVDLKYYQKQRRGDTEPLLIRNVAGIFIVYAVLMMASMVVFAVELICAKFHGCLVIK